VRVSWGHSREVMESVDLAALLKRVAQAGGVPSSGAVVEPPERTDASALTEVLDEPQKVSAEPLEVAGFVDGVQSSVTLRHIEHRPVVLQYSAAAAVGEGGVVAAISEKLEIVHSMVDTEWALEVADGIHRVTVEPSAPHDVIVAQVQHLRAERVERERVVVETAAGDGWLILDGSLIGRPVREGVVGVVKTTARRYLPDEAQLWKLQEGWRSSRFLIPAGVESPQDRYSCYLRLFDSRSQGWDFGLIRLEAFEADTLDALAARCMAERQGSSKDARWDRHLSGVRMVEDVLRARRPELL
jgi:hypothetical protein